jgi:GINS complex subunit 2
MSVSSAPTHFTVNEMEFLAEETPITILPMFSSPVLQLLEGEFGPFRPQLPLAVPLWLAIQLKKAKKCQIKTPNWLEVENLEFHLDREKRDPVQLAAIHFHFDEIARLLLHYAREDLNQPQRIEELLGDIRDIRQAKVRSSLQQVHFHSRVLALGEIGAMEVNALRDSVAHAMQVFHSFRQAGRGEIEDGAAAGAPEPETRRGGVIQQSSQPLPDRSTVFELSQQQAPSQPYRADSAYDFMQPSQPPASQALNGSPDADDSTGDQRRIRRFR